MDADLPSLHSRGSLREFERTRLIALCLLEKRDVSIPFFGCASCEFAEAACMVWTFGRS